MSTKYIYYFQYNQIQTLTEEDGRVIDFDTYKEFYDQYGEDIEKDFGTIGWDKIEDKLIYVPKMINIIAHKTDLYWSLGTLPKEASDDFIQAQVTAKRYYEVQNKETPNTLSYYYDGDIHLITINPGEKFDKETKTIVQNPNYVVDEIATLYNPRIVERDVAYNGFDFEINGVTYRQPYRGTEDITYFTAQKMLPVEEREIHLYRTVGGHRDSSNYVIIKGVDVSDELLNSILANILKYGNRLKRAINEYSSRIETLRSSGNVEALRELLVDPITKVDNIIKEME